MEESAQLEHWAVREEEAGTSSGKGATFGMPPQTSYAHQVIYLSGNPTHNYVAFMLIQWDLLLCNMYILIC